ncbi:hypothetical protein ACEWY4_002865 [Coilia grayii]|uniref:Sodium/myo-inositol cotransporter 2 n=1 Tax=Coilia grayii TaxID=363190 RepID=A0ABD1KPQ2_9TELE
MLTSLGKVTITEINPLGATGEYTRQDAALNKTVDYLSTSVPTYLSTYLGTYVIVQRSLAAKNLVHAKGGSLLAAYLKVLPFFIMVLPGMISRILFPDEVACADPELCKEVCGNPVGCSDIAYAKLVMQLLPNGLRGLMMAVMLAALMSSLTSIFNSSSTIFTMDLWRHIRKQASEWELMIVGRVFVLVLVVVSVLWIPLVQASQGGQLFIYIQAISTYLQPPVSVVFIAGCFWKRTNEKGAFWGLLVGLIIGCVRMILDFVYPTPLCYEEDTRPAVVKYVHYLYFSVILTAITAIIVVCVSLATEKPLPEQIRGLTWFSRYEGLKRRGETPHTDSEPPEAKESPEKHGNGNSSNGAMREQRRDSASTHSSVSSGSRLKRTCLWLCGLEKPHEGQGSPAPPPPAATIDSLEEDRCMRAVVDANLIVCLSVAVFLIAYWA